MKTTLDEQALFGDQPCKLELDSFSRSSVERSVTGLDGVLSIDLGKRSRRIKQTGSLTAASRLQMTDRIAAISDLVDGSTHTLVTGEGSRYANLRMDSFKVVREYADSSSLRCDYEIIYRQLGA